MTQNFSLLLAILWMSSVKERWYNNFNLCCCICNYHHLCFYHYDSPTHVLSSVCVRLSFCIGFFPHGEFFPHILRVFTFHGVFPWSVQGHHRPKSVVVYVQVVILALSFSCTVSFSVSMQYLFVCSTNSCSFPRK